MLERTEVVPSAARDGFLRLRLGTMLSVRMVHLVSGLDDEPDGNAVCGTATSITGYTEWISEIGAAKISLGWDWCLERQRCGDIACVRVGLPRSNVMLVDGNNRDYGWDRNLEVLASVVDALSWSEKTCEAIQLG